MSSLCPECHENSVEDDSHFAQIHRVCTNCGYVLEEQSFQADKDQQDSFIFNNGTCPTSSVSSKYQWQNRKRKSLGHRNSVREITELCKIMKMPSVRQKRATDLFEEAYEKDCFKNLLSKKKHVLSGCCVYVSCREEGWPVTIKYMCDQLQCTRSDFNSVYKSLLSTFDLQVRSPGVEDVVKTSLNKCRLDKPDFVNKTMQVIQLAKEVWISAGRVAEPLAVAAIYIVWKSQCGSSIKHATFKSFCQTHEISSTCASVQRVSELQQVLLRLAQQIPWVNRDKLTVKNITAHLSDILDYEQTLKSSVLNEDESEAFTPPSQKRRKPESDYTEPDCVYVSNSSELTELDIPESEMHNYIKSPEEVAMCSAMYSVIDES